MAAVPLRLTGATRRFRNHGHTFTVFEQLDLAVEDRELFVLLGPSGSGKSTLLRVIAGIVVADTGRVVLDGVDVTRLPTHRRSIGMVFQDEQLFPHMNVGDNVGFGLRMAGRSKPARRARVAELLDVVGLAGFSERRIDGLSGGERKRVALARSLAPEPKLLLLDEPLTGLDDELHDRLAGEVSEILSSTGTTALWVTHDRDEAAAVAARTVLLGDLSDAASHPRVVDLRPADTHPLRRQVLRTGTLSDQVVFDGDELDTTFHLGLRIGDELVAISTWLAQPYPDRPGETGFQLRGMATSEAHRGEGLGTRLLEAGVERCRERGATIVWARARDTAVAFYARHGFVAVGAGYVDSTTGLPHHDIVREIG